MTLFRYQMVVVNIGLSFSFRRIGNCATEGFLTFRKMITRSKSYGDFGSRAGLIQGEIQDRGQVKIANFSIDAVSIPRGK